MATAIVIPAPSTGASDECTHPTREVRYRDYSNGTRHYVRQCIECGNCTNAIKKSELAPTDIAIAIPVDDTLWQQYWARQCAIRAEKRNSEREEERTAFFEEHDAYLQTEEWRWRRIQVLIRDQYRCQARMRGCSERATQVHHLSYKHWKNEPLWDLTSVCKSCHEQITEADRKNAQ